MQADMRQTSTLAITSLIAGILGWTAMPFIGSLVAIICGHLARAEFRREPGRLDGEGYALAGLILGWSSIIMMMIALVLVVLVFGGVAAVIAAQSGRH